MSDPPRSAADPRPDGKPYYIEPDCPTHHTPLIPFETASGWHDEWECPQCPDTIWMDWPPAEQEQR